MIRNTPRAKPFLSGSAYIPTVCLHADSTRSATCLEDVTSLTVLRADTEFLLRVSRCNGLLHPARPLSPPGPRLSGRRVPVLGRSFIALPRSEGFRSIRVQISGWKRSRLEPSNCFQFGCERFFLGTNPALDQLLDIIPEGDEFLDGHLRQLSRRSCSSCHDVFPDLKREAQARNRNLSSPGTHLTIAPEPANSTDGKRYSVPDSNGGGTAD